MAYRVKELGLPHFEVTDISFFHEDDNWDILGTDSVIKENISATINLEMLYSSEKSLKLVSHLKDTFAEARKVGFLKMYENGWIRDKYTEYIFILTNIG